MVVLFICNLFKSYYFWVVFLLIILVFMCVMFGFVFVFVVFEVGGLGFIGLGIKFEFILIDLIEVVLLCLQWVFDVIWFSV